METSLSNEDVNGMVNIMKNDNSMAKIDDLEKNTVNKSYENPLYISSAEKKERRNKRRRMTWGQKHLYHECKVSTRKNRRNLSIRRKGGRRTDP